MTLTDGKFLKYVEKHQMTIARDDGVYRHIRFRNPETSAYWFDIITWPGCLCIHGDNGTYVFERLEDMLEFFRREPNDKAVLSINPDYWAQKLQAQQCNGKNPGNVRRWSNDCFEEAVKRDVIEHMRYNMTDMPKERLDLIAHVRDELLGGGFDDEHDALRAANDFHWTFGDKPRYPLPDDRVSFYFEDFWDHNFTEWDMSFLWNCYAIGWGIQRYDEAKAKKEAA